MEDKAENKSTYGKRPLWQLIVIYLVVALVIYGLIYYFVMNKKGPNTTSSNQVTKQQTQTLPAENREVAIPLLVENNSGESGKAILKQYNGQFTVTIALTGAPLNIPQPAHIHAGQCPNVGAIKFALNPVINGKSTTILQITLDQLKKMEPIAINVHKSKSEITTYTACGNVNL